jgi:hypothetical protein
MAQKHSTEVPTDLVLELSKLADRRATELRQRAQEYSHRDDAGEWRVVALDAEIMANRVRESLGFEPLTS